MIHFDGKEVQKNLKRLGDRLQRQGAGKAVKASADPVVQEAVLRAPRSTGEPSVSHLKYGSLASNIAKGKVRPVRRYGKIVGFKIDVGVQDAFWALFLEKGWIAAGRLSRKERGSKGRRVPARPFFEPAFEKSYKDALNAMLDSLRRFIDQSLPRNSAK
jgi:HK97 gp10 family phage protein